MSVSKMEKRNVARMNAEQAKAKKKQVRETKMSAPVKNKKTAKAAKRR